MTENIQSPENVAGSSSVGSKFVGEHEAAQRHTLEPEPPGARYDSELELLCRIAASVGGKQEAPLSYTALVIAFLFGEDKVSTWFQTYVRNQKLNLEGIFSSKDIHAEDRELHVSRAASGVLPDANPLYSRSVRHIMEQAARIARDISSDQLHVPVLGARHVMAAYAFRNPSDHRDQVRGWGFREADWQQQFLAFAQQSFPGEQWSRLQGSPRPHFETISSFTSDDPLSPPRDLLGVEDEAAAFARVAAAKSIKPPLAVGIFGEWGSGKTFFMRRVYENVRTLMKRAADRPDQSPFHSDIVQIRFNAWHYIETNLWASLVENIFTELDRWLLDKTQNARPKADLLFNRLATAQQLKLDALEDVVTRRAERRSAELRAERARRDYEEALARSAAVSGNSYVRALLDTFLKEEGVRENLNKIGDAIGAPKIAGSAGHVMDLIEEARSEAGRTRLIARAGIRRLGTWPWIATVVLVLIALPLLAVGLKDGVSRLRGAEAIKSIHDTVLALAGLVAGIAGCGGVLLRQASSAVRKIDEFGQTLNDRVTEQIQRVRESGVAKSSLTAEDDLKKRRQAMEAAERALADAETRLTAARQDFESATARSRLNAFIRAKATEGDYAKHLGIIASIRRDFGQLATLMGAATDSDDQRAESLRLAAEARARVERFLKWLEGEPEVRLTPGELHSLLSLLEPEEAKKVVESRRETLAEHIEGGDPEVEALATELQDATQALPKFSRIILYIDDLDRCPPKTVVDVLQAVHLLLSFPLFTVFVAVDARWVSRALREQFPKLLAETGMFFGNGEPSLGAGASSHDYLEKIFQIPYWVRPVDAESSAKYVNSLLEPDVRRVATATVDGSTEFSSRTQDRSSEEGTPPSGPSARPAKEASDSATDASQAGQEHHEASSLELTRWEADALEHFAPMVSATPRRLIRFVNVFRLIKTSLPPDLLRSFVGEKGETDDYRALVAQLAIVTAAPDTSPQYFSALEQLAKAEPLAKVTEHLIGDVAFQGGRDHETVERILVAARQWYGRELKVEHMLATARLARRYSFTARPH